MNDPVSNQSYRPTYDLQTLTPSQVAALNRDLESRRAHSDAAADALIEDLNQLPHHDFEKSLELIDFLVQSDSVPDRTCAAFALPNLTIEAARRDQRATEIGLIWANLLTDDQESPRETSMAGFAELIEQGLVSMPVVAEIAVLLAEKLNSSTSIRFGG